MIECVKNFQDKGKSVTCTLSDNPYGAEFISVSKEWHEWFVEVDFIDGSHNSCYVPDHYEDATTRETLKAVPEDVLLVQ